LVTWSPAIVLGIGQHFYFEITGDNLFQTAAWWLAVGTLLPLVFGALWTVAHPERGLHDRLTGTWIVPR
jgi:galactose mutarotase-like enzyme